MGVLVFIYYIFFSLIVFYGSILYEKFLEFRNWIRRIPAGIIGTDFQAGFGIPGDSGIPGFRDSGIPGYRNSSRDLEPRAPRRPDSSKSLWQPKVISLEPLPTARTFGLEPAAPPLADNCIQLFNHIIPQIICTMTYIYCSIQYLSNIELQTETLYTN